MKRYVQTFLGVLVGLLFGAFIADAVAGRDSSGNYTPTAPYGTVTTGSTISSAWANALKQDLVTEISNSLDRTGKGSMLNPLKLVAGTVAAPALTSSSDFTTGLYFFGAGNASMSTLGAQVQSWSSAATTITGATTLTGSLTVSGSSSLSTLTSGTSTLAATTVSSLSSTNGISTVNSGVALSAQSTGGGRGAISLVGQNDPSSPGSGDVWFNPTSTAIGAYMNGAKYYLATQQASAPMVLSWSRVNITGSYMFGTGTAAGGVSTVTAGAYIVPKAGRIANFTALISCTGTISDTVTILKNGVATALTCTAVTSGTACVDSTHSVTVAAGDLLQSQIGTLGGTCTGGTASTADALSSVLYTSL